VTRAAGSAAAMSTLLGGLLSRVSAGSAEVALDSVPFASVDAPARNLELQILPLLRGPRGARSTDRPKSPFGVWRSRGVPAELARRGWRLTLYDGTDELLVLGRGTSALTGHVRLHPAALLKLRKLV
jgi:hypothetical protein